MKVLALALVVVLAAVALTEGRTLVSRDLKSDLIAKGEALIKQADAEVAKLTGLQRLTEAAIVRQEEQAIRQLITQLEAATNDQTVTRLERELQAAETRLNAEIEKITKAGPATDPIIIPILPGGDAKARLIARGQALITEADAAVQKLTGQAKDAEARIVKTEEDAIRRLVTELEAATSELEILRLEAELNRAELRLQQEIAKINATPSAPVVPVVPVVVPETPAVPAQPVPDIPIFRRDTKSDLIAKGEALAKQADAEVQKLNGLQKVQEAAIVKVEEARINALVAELEAASTPAALTRIEGELAQAEAKLSFEIAKIEAESKSPISLPILPGGPILPEIVA